MGRDPGQGAQSSALFWGFYRSSTATSAPAATTTAILGRQLCFTQNVGRVSGSESPNGPSSGVIITSLGGDTLCPSRHLVQPFLERGMQWWSQPVWTAAESLSPQLADLFHRRSRGHGRWSRSGLRGAKDAVGRGGQRTRGSRDAETTLRIAGFTPLALSKPAVVAEDLLYR